jgi:hypothetical protein
MMTRQSIIALLSGVALLGVVASSSAQVPAPSPSPAPAPSASPSAPADKPVSPAPSTPDVKADIKTDSRETTVQSRGVDRSDRSDSPSALPRTTSDRSTIFGLSPTAAIVLGGALLLIVILAIVAMGRGTSTTTYIDPDRDRRL